jgi:hypothetical protein
MSKDLPALTGPELIKLLKKDGWEEHGYRTHGLSLKNNFEIELALPSFPPAISLYLPKPSD